MCIWVRPVQPGRRAAGARDERIENEFDEIIRALDAAGPQHHRVSTPCSTTWCQPIRIHRLLNAGASIWCIAPKGEPDEARFARLRKFEDFFLGLAVHVDDVVSPGHRAGGLPRRRGW